MIIQTATNLASQALSGESSLMSQLSHGATILFIAIWGGAKFLEEARSMGWIKPRKNRNGNGENGNGLESPLRHLSISEYKMIAILNEQLSLHFKPLVEEERKETLVLEQILDGIHKMVEKEDKIEQARMMAEVIREIVNKPHQQPQPQL